MKNRKSSKIKKKYYHPKMSKEAAEKLKRFYLEMRNKSPNSVTIRDYDSLLWFAEDSARSRNNKRVTSEDARKAIDTWLKTKERAK